MKAKKDDDLSRFNSSSSSADNDADDDGDKDHKKEDDGISRELLRTKNSAKHSSSLLAVERKKRKKREMLRQKQVRRKRERELKLLEVITTDDADDDDSKKKKKKKKKKKTARDGAAGTPVAIEQIEMSRKKSKINNNSNNSDLFEVEGIMTNDGILVLVDKKRNVVYSAEERDLRGEHLRIGVWDSVSKAVKYDDKYTEEERKRKNDDGDDESSSSSDGDDEASSSDDEEEEEEEEEKEEEEEEEEQPTAKRVLDVDHTFECNADDHCETSLEAHKDIVNFLNIAASQRNKKPSELVIYDPYYCAGATKFNFEELGFPNVINENKDFYEMIEKNLVPEHDVFVTNPPYSEEHVEKCVTFAAKNMNKFGRPYFMLVPSYVVCKPYFVPALLTGGAQGAKEKERENDNNNNNNNDNDNDDDDNDDNKLTMHEKKGQVLPFYVAPTKRYYYFTPKPLAKLRNINNAENGTEKKRRGHVGRRGERTSPFLSLWICGFGENQSEAIRLHKKLRREQVKHYVVARNPKEIPLNVLDEWDPRKKESEQQQGSKTKTKFHKGKQHKRLH